MPTQEEERAGIFIQLQLVNVIPKIRIRKRRMRKKSVAEYLYYRGVFATRRWWCAGTSAGFWLGGQCPLAAWEEENFENLTTKWCILKYRPIWINMWSAYSAVLYTCLPWLLSKYNANTENCFLFCMFLLFIFSSFFQGGGQLIPFAHICGHQLSLASLRGRLIEYQLWLGVRTGMSPLPGGR